MESQEILFKRFIRNQCTLQEIEALLAQFNSGDNEAVLREMILEQLKNEEDIPALQLPDLSKKEESIYAALLPHLRKRPVGLWPRVAVAASITIALSFGAYCLLHKPQEQQAAYYKNDIAPGHNQATLTLANGKKIVLTKGLSGKLAQQGNVLIGVNGQNSVAYIATGANANLPVAYNTLSTSRGEQSPYPLVLADGTKVWLNAESSITFPVVFNGKDRTVKVTGEAYFEVTHNNAHPFKVAVRNQMVEDIGTHFNINAYNDEPDLKTTLLEGSVKVSEKGQTVTLQPGQQSLIQDSNSGINVKSIDLEEVTAWKDGYFDLNNANLESIMRQVSRWYDVDVIYSDNSLKAQVFSGTISRFKNVSKLLTKLQLTGAVHFKIDGRKVFVGE